MATRGARDLDRPADALPYLDYAINNLSDGRLRSIKQYVEEIIQLERLSATDSADLSVLTEIAAKYYSMGNKTGASKYIGKVLRADPKNNAALALAARLRN